MSQKTYNAHLIKYKTGYKAHVQFDGYSSTAQWFKTKDEAVSDTEKMVFRNHLGKVKWGATINKVKNHKPRCRCDDGSWVYSGDSIMFSYGIPPVRVIADIADENGSLIGVCRGDHTPKTFNLRGLRRYVSCWYKTDGASN